MAGGLALWQSSSFRIASVLKKNSTVKTIRVYLVILVPTCLLMMLSLRIASASGKTFSFESRAVYIQMKELDGP